MGYRILKGRHALLPLCMSLFLAAGVMLAPRGAAAQDDAAERLALATEVIEVSQTEQLMASTTNMILPMEMLKIRKAHPQFSPEQLKVIEEVLRDEMAELFKEVVATFATVYAETFTVGELEDLLAFYKSETGQSLIDKMPIIMERGMQASLGVMMRRMPGLQDRIRPRLAERGIDL